MKKYRNDYRKKGNRYEYTGQWYRTKLSEQELKKTVLSSMILGILALGFYIGGMCLNNNGSRVAWVLLPFVIPAFTSCLCDCRQRCFISADPPKWREYFCIGRDPTGT